MCFGASRSIQSLDGTTSSTLPRLGTPLPATSDDGSLWTSPLPLDRGKDTATFDLGSQRGTAIEATSTRPGGRSREGKQRYTRHR